MENRVHGCLNVGKMVVSGGVVGEKQKKWGGWGGMVVIALLGFGTTYQSAAALS